MIVENALEVLAILENLRIMEEAHQPDAEFALRKASAYVAQFFGYTNRADWTSLFRESGLVAYSLAGDPAAARANLAAMLQRHK